MTAKTMVKPVQAEAPEGDLLDGSVHREGRERQIHDRFDQTVVLSLFSY